MYRTKTNLLTVVLLASILLAACAPSTPQTPTIDANQILTQAAGTVAVELTRVSALTPSPMPATSTPAPTNTPQATATTGTQPTAPAPVQATNTQPVTAPVGGGPDAASFVADVTVPDGTGALPGSKFEKVWRIKNTGTTTWTADYDLVYIDGDQMGAPESIPMPKDVRPEETVDISVMLTAPATPGSYQTFFRLRNASGQFFRLDSSGDLWVKISVGTGSTATIEPTATGEAAATEAPDSGPSN